MDYQQALRYIYSFTNFEVTPAGTYSSKTFDLRRMEELVASLGHPERKMQFVHVGGTKGKGSTAAMIESVLRSAGHRTGLYTSPHLHTFRERIRVSGQMITQSQVAEGIDRLAAKASEIGGVTTFEVMTALALDYFAGREVKYAVLEVGLGGRLDATNIVTPLVSVITSISYDHTAILGNTLTQIAREKAGIIKSHKPVISSPQAPEAAAALSQIANEKMSPMTMLTDELAFTIGATSYRIVGTQSTLESQSFALRASNEPQVEITMPLGGHHQLVNAATAIAGLEWLSRLGVHIPPEGLSRGLESVRWIGRLEIIAHAPLIVLDGAHNADSMHQLIQTLRTHSPKSRIHIIFGASSDKDINGMFSEILPYAASLILTRSHNPRAAELTTLESLAHSLGIRVSLAANIRAAVSEARRFAQSEDVICVTGSLFVVGEARDVLLAEQGAVIEKD